MTHPAPSLRGILAAASVLVSLAGCGRGDPSTNLRVSEEAPLPAVGADEKAPPRVESSGGTVPSGGLATFVATLPARTVVVPRPELPDPSAARGAASPQGFTPKLTGRSPDGKEVLELPLAHTRVVAQVSGNVARVEVTQYYVNPSNDRLEAIYAFPLPPNAAVTDMLFRIGNRVVLSEVKRREEAKRTYEAAKQEGRTAALTEQERPNLFTQSVANVPPGDTVAVVLRYVHEVPFDAGRYLFHFPTTIGPRYIPGSPSPQPSPPARAGGEGVGLACAGGEGVGLACAGGEGVGLARAGGEGAPSSGGPGWSPDTGQVPDASRVTPPVLHPSQKPAHDVDILVRLVPAAAFDDVVARSHRVATGVDGSGARLVALAEDDRVPNKDFVLSWKPAGSAPAAHAIVQREKGEEFAMLFVQPPAEVAPAMVRPKELVFLVDKSGSMMGAPIERAKSVIERALDALGPDDTFQIIAFDGATQSMTAAPLPRSAENVARAKAWLARLSGGGGTEMLAGIRAALGAPSDPRRLRMVVFCTDGFIGNEPQVIEAVEALRGSSRVFGFGIGTSVNRYLIEGVGRAGRGTSEIIDLKDRPDDAVARLFKRLDRPVLTDLEVAFEGATVTDLLPARLPDLFAAQPVVVVGRVRGGTPSRVVLRGRLGDRPYESRVTIAAGGLHPDVSGTSQPVVGTLWARRRIDDLLSARPAAPAQDAVEEVVAHALRFKLVTPYTSFVAVERELRIDPKLPLAQAIVPNELPEGVSYEGIFGPAGEVQVLPARVKPGDPELRVQAIPDAVAVRVALPFEPAPRDAIRDDARGDWVLRFLVPPGWPDGSYDARISIARAGGAVEERVAPIRVDTTPAAIVVIAAPASARRGAAVRLAVKPALPLARLVDVAGRPGGIGNALKGAMEVKEVLVRAPWGEVVRARMDGPLGVYVADLRVPPDAAEGPAAIEVAASDAAGNVSRRRVPIAVRAGGAPADAAVAYAGMGGLLAFTAVVLAAALAAVMLRRPRKPRPLERALVAGSGEARPRSVMMKPEMHARIRVAAACALAAVVLLAAAWKHRERARHLALPVLADASLPAPAAADLGHGPAWPVEAVANVGARVTAVLAASDGDLWIGTFDRGLYRLSAAAAPATAVPGLLGRQLFVNALVEHDGLVWAATQGGLLAFDGDRRALALLGGEGVTALAVAGGSLYAGTARGVFRASIEEGAESVDARGPAGEPLRVTALATGTHALWIGTASGAYSLPLAQLAAPLLERTARWHPLVFGESAAETNVVTALAAMGDGAVAGTDDGGVVRVDDGGSTAAARFSDPRANEVNPGAAGTGPGGTALLGTQGGGLLLARRAGRKLEVTRLPALGRAAISAVSVDAEEVLVGTAEGAVLRIRVQATVDPG